MYLLRSDSPDMKTKKRDRNTLPRFAEIVTRNLALKHCRRMFRLQSCFWINILFCIVNGCWTFTKAGGNQLYFAVIRSNIAGCINAWDVCFHFRIDDDAVLFNLQSPILNWPQRRDKAIVT